MSQKLQLCLAIVGPGEDRMKLRFSGELDSAITLCIPGSSLVDSIHWIQVQFSAAELHTYSHQTLPEIWSRLRWHIQMKRWRQTAFAQHYLTICSVTDRTLSNLTNWRGLIGSLGVFTL